MVLNTYPVGAESNEEEREPVGEFVFNLMEESNGGDGDERG